MRAFSIARATNGDVAKCRHQGAVHGTDLPPCFSGTGMLSITIPGRFALTMSQTVGKRTWPVVWSSASNLSIN